MQADYYCRADTTRTVLTTCFVYMLQEPDRFLQLQQVLDDALGDRAVPSHDELAKIGLLQVLIFVNSPKR